MKAFLRFFMARYRRAADEMKFRYYMADCAAGVMMMLGAKDVPRLYDLDHPQAAEAEDSRSPEEIAHERLERMGIKVVTDG